MQDVQELSHLQMLEKHVLSLRTIELNTRDKILHEIRQPCFTAVWRSAGRRSLRQYCQDTLGYGAVETREILVKIGHILTRDSMMSDDAENNLRIKRLISWRTHTALEQRQPAYRILSNRTLLTIANENPTDLDALKNIPGMGDAKIRGFGPAILKILASSNHPAP